MRNNSVRRNRFESNTINSIVDESSAEETQRMKIIIKNYENQITSLRERYE